MQDIKNTVLLPPFKSECADINKLRRGKINIWYEHSEKGIITKTDFRYDPQLKRHIVDYTYDPSFELTENNVYTRVSAGNFYAQHMPADIGQMRDRYDNRDHYVDKKVVKFYDAELLKDYIKIYQLDNLGRRHQYLGLAEQFEFMWQFYCRHLHDDMFNRRNTYFISDLFMTLSSLKYNYMRYDTKFIGTSNRPVANRTFNKAKHTFDWLYNHQHFYMLDGVDMEMYQSNFDCLGLAGFMLKPADIEPYYKAQRLFSKRLFDIEHYAEFADSCFSAFETTDAAYQYMMDTGVKLKKVRVKEVIDGFITYAKEVFDKDFSDFKISEHWDYTRTTNLS